MDTIKSALRAITAAHKITLRAATGVRRRHPLFDEELSISEELINLEEALMSRRTALPSIGKYPKMQLHVNDEIEQILLHCVGLINRMCKGRKLTYAYDSRDIQYAVRRLVILLVEDYEARGERLRETHTEFLRPFMNLRQRLQYREWSYSPLWTLRQAFRRIVSAS